MICRFEDYLAPLAEYAKAPEHHTLLHETVAKVYGDLLSFCHKARRVFVDKDGNLRRMTSFRLFLRQQWEPFEATFEPLNTYMQHHLNILLHAIQASQLTILRKAENREKGGLETTFGIISLMLS